MGGLIHQIKVFIVVLTNTVARLQTILEFITFILHMTSLSDGPFSSSVVLRTSPTSELLQVAA